MEKKLSLYELAIDENIDGYEIDGKLITEEQLLKEDFIENALMVAGFVPVIGEVFDSILIIRYLTQKRYIEAGLMLIALIPGVGDMAVKPVLLLLKKVGLTGGVKGARLTSKAFAEVLSKPENAAIKASYLKLVGKLQMPVITKLIKQLTDKFKFLSPMFTKTLAKHAETEALINAGKTSKVVSGYHKLNRFEKYVMAHGKAPGVARQYWQQILARHDRKFLAKKIITFGNILGALGIFSLKDLDNKMKDDKEAEKLMQNPDFAKFMGSFDETGGTTTGNVNTNQILGAINTEKGVDLLKFMSKFVPA
jgi:hypothetical protein